MRRDVPLAAAAALAVGATLAATGQWPDPARSIDLLTAGGVTAQSEVAFMALLGWIAVAGLTLNAVLTALRGRRGGSPAGAAAWPLIVLVVGVALLVAGVARHTGYRVCCATPSTAQQAAGLVR